MVYTETALRRQQFHVAPAMQQLKSATSTPLPWILIIRAIKRIQSLIQNHMRHERNESAREWRIALYKSDEESFFLTKLSLTHDMHRHQHCPVKRLVAVFGCCGQGNTQSKGSTLRSFQIIFCPTGLFAAP